MEEEARKKAAIANMSLHYGGYLARVSSQRLTLISQFHQLLCWVIFQKFCCWNFRPRKTNQTKDKLIGKRRGRFLLIVVSHWTLITSELTSNNLILSWTNPHANLYKLFILTKDNFLSLLISFKEKSKLSRLPKIIIFGYIFLIDFEILG